MDTGRSQWWEGAPSEHWEQLIRVNRHVTRVVRATPEFCEVKGGSKNTGAKMPRIALTK